MMSPARIYEQGVAAEYQWALPVDSSDFQCSLLFDGSSKAEGWVPVRMYLLERHSARAKRLKRADLPWSGHDSIALSSHAVDVLGPFLLRYGELLPLSCESEELWVFNITNVVDALIEEASDLERFSTGRIMMINRHVFDPVAIGDSEMFRIPQLLRSPIFVTQSFVDLVDTTGLKGTPFGLVWELD